MTPEQEELLGKKMAELAKEENRALQRRLGTLALPSENVKKPTNVVQLQKKKKIRALPKVEKPKPLNDKKRILLEDLQRQKRELEHLISKLGEATR